MAREEEARRASGTEGGAVAEVERGAHRPADELGAGQRRLVRWPDAPARTDHWHCAVEARQVPATADPLGAGAGPGWRIGAESLLHHRPDASGGRGGPGFCAALDGRSDVRSKPDT